MKARFLVYKASWHHDAHRIERWMRAQTNKNERNRTQKRNLHNTRHTYTKWRGRESSGINCELISSLFFRFLSTCHPRFVYQQSVFVEPSILSGAAAEKIHDSCNFSLCESEQLLHIVWDVEASQLWQRLIYSMRSTPKSIGNSVDSTGERIFHF